MGMLNQIIGALVEAWGEVKVQKARVVLSLVGVTAAVAAMSLVIAMGDLLEQWQRESMEAYAGREVTLHINAYQSGENSEMREGVGSCVGSGCYLAEEDAPKADGRAEANER